MDLGLKGRVAIVAAASKGLGRAIAEEFAKEGCEVAICARTAADVERAAKEIGATAGREIFWRALDVTNADAVRDFVAAVEQKFGRIDICVTNAGGPPSKKFLEITLDEWRTAVNLTLLSSVYFAREVLPRMQRRRWGRLLTITSISVKQPIDGLMLSNSLRAGVAGMAKTLANEFGAGRHHRQQRVPRLHAHRPFGRAFRKARARMQASPTNKLLKQSQPRTCPSGALRDRMNWPRWWRFSHPNAPAPSMAPRIAVDGGIIERTSINWTTKQGSRNVRSHGAVIIISAFVAIFASS